MINPFCKAELYNPYSGPTLSTVLQQQGICLNHILYIETFDLGTMIKVLSPTDGTATRIESIGE